MSGLEYYKRKEWSIDSRGFHYRWIRNDNGKWYKLYRVKGKFQVQTEHGKIVDDINTFKCPTCTLCDLYPKCKVFPFCSSCKPCKSWPNCWEKGRELVPTETKSILTTEVQSATLSHETKSIELNKPDEIKSTTSSIAETKSLEIKSDEIKSDIIHEVKPTFATSHHSITGGPTGPTGPEGFGIKEAMGQQDFKVV